MLRFLTNPLLLASGAGVAACYPALVDQVTQFIANNQLLDPEDAHNAFISAGEWGLLPDYRHMTWRLGSTKQLKSSRLATELWGHKLTSPVGVAAGLDKNARIIDPLFGLGFGFVEIGSVTPLPQEGNARPRVFRLVEDRAVINRYGFNSDGTEPVRSRLISYRQTYPITPGLLGINLGKNKDTVVASDDYIKAMKELGEFGDYLVVNISSPNTAGLRTLQGSSEMEQLIVAIQEERLKSDKLKKKPLAVKIAPDLDRQQIEDIVSVALKTNIDGLIVTNTTIARPEDLKSEHKKETGGLSGRPLKERSLQVLKEVAELSQGKITLIAAGGIESGEDAYQRLLAGASLVQVYSAISYGGPGLASRINDELDAILEKNGHESVQSLRSKSL